MLLITNGAYNNCDGLNICCYSRLLDDFFELDHLEPREVRSVRQVAHDFDNNVLLIRIDGHLTCSRYGVIYDIWDCTNEEVTDFWII